MREVAPGESLGAFVELAWQINAADPAWVPPLRLSLKTALDRRRHPFHRHAEVAYFLAERGGAPVGRIAAIVNRLHVDFQEERAGFFGLFECEDDEQTARALLETAAAWLKARGMERMRGPMNFSTNEEVSSPGVLVDGFTTPPAVMMSHNPPYYARLLEAAGLEKEKDLLAYWIDDPNPPESLLRVAERMAEKQNLVLRSLDMRRFAQEVATIQEIYNAAWSRNWGFVPMTEAEFEHMASELKPIVDPDLCLIAEVDGQPVGFSLALPNLNEALRHLKRGRLFPFGIFRLLWQRRHIHSARILTLGLKPGFQNQGIGTAFYLRTFLVGARKGYVRGEASWILEDNWDMRGPLEKMGAAAYKTYRVYTAPL